MATCPRSETAETRVKPRGSDNAWYVNFPTSKIQEIPKDRRRAPRVGLLGGRGKRHRTIDRFWARVQKNPNPDGCWIFAGAPCSLAGHVHISLDDGRRMYAHRFSYELHHGPIPAGLVVMHSCDVPACVNPAHLSVGTQRDNVHDAIDKGRFSPWTHPNTVAAKQQRRHVSTVGRRSVSDKTQTVIGQASFPRNTR